VNMTLYYQIILVAIVSMFNTGVCSAVTDQEIFDDIFQYELNNRAFAYISVLKLSERMINTEQADFWNAYSRLEKLSYSKYQPVSEKYGLAPQSYLVKAKAWITNIAFQLFPEKMLSIMTDATAKYVDKLRPLISLAKIEDKEFFEYVLAQEQTQAKALAHANNGNFELATKALIEFLGSQK
jgi:hypothetical protein